MANCATRIRSVIDQHAQHPLWSSRIPLDCQEYRVLLPDDVYFEKPLKRTLEATNWSASYVRAFTEAVESAAAVASRLLMDFDTLAAECARFAELAAIIRGRVAAPLHLIQAQLLTRMSLVLGSVKGLAVLEIGPEDGALFFELERLGAAVAAIDLAPKFFHANLQRGDFMSLALPRGAFDVIVATAVFEAGSERDAGAPAAAANLTPTVLDRFVSLLKPGGSVFLENLCSPLPFSAADARVRGFEVLDVRVPGVNFNFGGRGCALRLPLDSKSPLQKTCTQ